jgi:hypothetical protein
MQLNQFSNLAIDWDLAPEDAVTLYLEWGNNSWHAKHQPVRSKSDFSHYFVVDNWGEVPKVLLIKRNSEAAEELFVSDLPEPLARSFRNEFGRLKGIFEPTDEIKNWLRQLLDN